MTENNPFAGLDLNALMQQAQAMQQQVVAAQQELAERTVDGTVGDGLVTVTVNGNGELVGVKIRSGSFDPDETVAAGLGADIPAQPTSGGFNIDEAYAEINAPLLADRPGFQLLELNGATLAPFSSSSTASI